MLFNVWKNTTLLFYFNLLMSLQNKWIDGKQHRQHSLGNFVCGRIMFCVLLELFLILCKLDHHYHANFGSIDLL